MAPSLRNWPPDTHGDTAGRSLKDSQGGRDGVSRFPGREQESVSRSRDKAAWVGSGRDGLVLLLSQDHRWPPTASRACARIERGLALL